MGKVNPEQKAELTALKSEYSRLKQNSDGMREQIAQLQSKASPQIGKYPECAHGEVVLSFSLPCISS